jgi:hypothetical protein
MSEDDGDSINLIQRLPLEQKVNHRIFVFLVVVAEVSVLWVFGMVPRNKLTCCQDPDVLCRCMSQVNKMHCFGYRQKCKNERNALIYGFSNDEVQRLNSAVSRIEVAKRYSSL